MKKLIFKGSAVALITPMKPDGSVNYDTLGKLIDFQIKNGTDAILVCATTGESPVLTHNEHCSVVEYTVKRVGKKVPVIASSGSNSTAYAVELSKDLQDAGADALLTITPYYNKTSQAGFVKHFYYIADRVNVPMILYNIPSRTGCNIKPETYLELSKHPNIVATKEANGDIAATAKTISLCGDALALYSGEDNQTLPMISLGGKGVISTTANVVPDVMHKICADYFAGSTESSRRTFLEYIDLMNALFVDVNPMPVKFAMNELGFACGPCRLPLTELSEENKNAVKAAMKKHGLI